MTSENQTRNVPATIDETQGELAEMMSSGQIDKYLYSFKQGKKEVCDLNVDGISRLAVSLGVSIEDVMIVEEDEVQITVKAIAVNRDGIRHFGLFRESKHTQTGYPNPHALTNATSKAQRNAKKGLLPMAEVREVIRNAGKTPVSDHEDKPPTEQKRTRTAQSDFV